MNPNPGSLAAEPGLPTRNTAADADPDPDPYRGTCFPPSSAAEPGLADPDRDPDPDRDHLNTCFPPSTAAEPGPSTSRSAADPGAVDLDRGPSNPSLVVLPKVLLIRDMQSGPPSSAANPILSKRKRAADLDRKSRTEIEADPMYSEATQTPLRSKRMTMCMEGDEEEKGTGSWEGAASWKRVVRPSSSADVCEPTPKRRKLTYGLCSNLHGDWKLVLPDGEGSHVCWRSITSSNHTDADNSYNDKPHTEIEADPLHSEATQTPPSSKRIHMCMEEEEEEEKGTGSWGSAASRKRVVQPSSSADVCEPTPKRQKLNSGKSNADSKMEIHDGEGSHSCWRSTTSPSELTDADNGYDNYLHADKSLDNEVESHHDDTSLKEQVFVHIGSKHISMQKEPNQTNVEMLIQSAFEKARLNANDYYCTYAGKCLDTEKLLSCYPIERNSTIKVLHRLRGGVRDQTVRCLTWEKIQLVPLPYFNVVPLPPQLCDMTRNITSTKFLSPGIQELAIMVFIALCGMHFRGGSLDGQFNESHLLFDGKKARFDDQLVVLGFTSERARNDTGVIFNIFQPLFLDNAHQDYPIHARHLLHFISNIPHGVNLQSPLVIAFIINHSALQTYDERINTCTMLDFMLIWEEMQYFISHIGLVPDWTPIVDVPALNSIRRFRSYWDPALQRRVIRYFQDGGSLNHLAFNFFKHGPMLPMDILEACFSAAMADQNFMPNLLQHIATFDQLLPNPPFDVVKIFGNKSV